MSNLLICDKCGKKGANVNDFMHVRGHRIPEPDRFYTNAEDYINVCKECYEKIFSDKEEK